MRVENGSGRWFDVVAVVRDRSLDVVDRVWAHDVGEALAFAHRRIRLGQLRRRLCAQTRLRCRPALLHPLSFAMRRARA